MPKYMIDDLEVQNHDKNKRFASPFCNENYIVARGWKYEGDKTCSWKYYNEWHRDPLHVPTDVEIIVGHNLKFDLLYDWQSPDLKAFFKRGGKIWCTQYAEYLLRGMDRPAHMVSMEDIAEKYGGTLKLDAVKDLWDAGYMTSQIDEDLLIDYLVGSEDEGRNAGDIGNTEKIYLGQRKLAEEMGMLPCIEAAMDSLLCTTEMEFNGLKIDVATALETASKLEEEADAIRERMQQYLPEFPDGFTFNWNSPVHQSCLIFGGTVMYEKSDTYIDPKTGYYARYKAEARWPLFQGEPVNPAVCCWNEDKQLFSQADEDETEPFGLMQDTYLSGKNKGAGKFKKVEVQGELKTKLQPFYFEFRGYTSPRPEWRGKNTDGKDQPIYSVAEDVIEELGQRNIPFLKDLARLKKIEKDLGTYYIRHDGKKYSGMLTCVDRDDHIVHHSLNHTSTVTRRLSSSNPNLQNIPKGETSDVKKMFISRFKNGTMLEADYSQLEVVVQGLLSNDKNLCKDLVAKVDFHCKRVSAWKGCTYDEAKLWCKDDTHPNYPQWKILRTNAKTFSFQRAYGAGAAKISSYTGMPIEDVKDLIEAEETMYPGVVKFNDAVEAAVKKSAKGFFDPSKGKTYRKGQYVAPTGTRYTFRSHDAPDWSSENDTFMPTELKNYPIQGTGGEIVQIVLGKLWRHFVSMDNYGGRALLCNTVHDCIWIDLEEDLVDTVAPVVKRIMEDVPKYLKELYGMECPVPFPVELETGKNLFDKQVIHI